MTILVVMAMAAEADPVRVALGLDGRPRVLHASFPAELWQNDRVALAVNGTDPRFSVDSIASQPAVTTTLHAIEATQPDLVISAGTAGGFESRGGHIGATYVADRVVYHDRRVPLAGFDRYGQGDYPVADLARAARAVGFQLGTVTTGNALDAPEVDRENMDATQALAKDMEAAAVAWTCERMDVPFSALKVITDLVDHPEPAEDQFLQNLHAATRRLATAVPALVDAILDDHTESTQQRTETS